MVPLKRSAMCSQYGLVVLIGVSLGMPVAAHCAESPTYHKDVEPILQKNCQECHRPGQVAPFSLLDYTQARKRAQDIAAVTEERTMPPWHASTTEGGPFRGARVLTDPELKTLAAWADAGCPEGDAKDAPPPREWSSDWTLGPPDLVLKMSEPYKLAPSGADEYRVVVIPVRLDERSVDRRRGLQAGEHESRPPHPLGL